MNHAEALRLAQAGRDKGSLETANVEKVLLEQYDRERGPLGRYLSFLGVDRETGQEIVQESFLKLQEHLLAGGDRTNLRAWLYRVSHNLARNIQASFRVARTEYVSDLETGSSLAVSNASAEETLLEAERHARYHAALKQLSPAQRQCLLLRTEGMKYREIAEVLHLSVSTVGENVTRGLEKLKELV